MALPILFDAVLFDLDGTLIATDRFWVQAARTGARRAFAELHLEREVPSAEEWMQLVGLPLEDGFRELFSDLPEVQWRRVMEACTEEEHGLLASGGVALMPGAEKTLDVLQAQGKRLGIASNCSRAYLDHMLAAGIGERVEAAYCLDSAGIGNKGDMIAELLGDFDTRSAVFVGDRRGDRDAAWSNGLPHVHCSFGFRPGGEEFECEATIEDLGELPALLRRRSAWIADALEALNVSDAAGLIGITGTPASGKSLFARDAVRLLQVAGVPAELVSLDAWARSRPENGASTAAELYDLDRLEAEAFSPRSSPGSTGGPVFVEGAYLLDPELRPRFDRVLHLELPEAVLWRRLAGREGRLGGPQALEPAREVFLPGYRAHRARIDPLRHADLVLDASNPLGATEGRPSPSPLSPA